MKWISWFIFDPVVTNQWLRIKELWTCISIRSDVNEIHWVESARFNHDERLPGSYYNSMKIKVACDLSASPFFFSLFLPITLPRFLSLFLFLAIPFSYSLLLSAYLCISSPPPPISVYYLLLLSSLCLSLSIPPLTLSFSLCVCSDITSGIPFTSIMFPFARRRKIGLFYAAKPIKTYHYYSRQSSSSLSSPSDYGSNYVDLKLKINRFFVQKYSKTLLFSLYCLKKCSVVSHIVADVVVVVDLVVGTICFPSNRKIANGKSVRKILFFASTHIHIQSTTRQNTYTHVATPNTHRTHNHAHNICAHITLHSTHTAQQHISLLSTPFTFQKGKEENFFFLFLKHIQRVCMYARVREEIFKNFKNIFVLFLFSIPSTRVCFVYEL